MTIAQQDIQRLAALAKIDISDEEGEAMAQALSQMVAVADVLVGLAVEDVEPTFRGVAIEGTLREDRRVSDFSREEILANAPERDEACFLTPKVLD